MIPQQSGIRSLYVLAFDDSVLDFSKLLNTFHHTSSRISLLSFISGRSIQLLFRFSFYFSTFLSPHSSSSLSCKPSFSLLFSVPPSSSSPFPHPILFHSLFLYYLFSILLFLFIFFFPLSPLSPPSLSHFFYLYTHTYIHTYIIYFSQIFSPSLEDTYI